MPRVNGAKQARGPRRTLLDRTIIWNGRQLRQIHNDYIDHYNAHRPLNSPPSTAQIQRLGLSRADRNAAVSSTGHMASRVACPAERAQFGNPVAAVAASVREQAAGQGRQGAPMNSRHLHR